MADISTQLSFEHMLAHLFPGFFTALTVVMILDLLSPSNVTELILKDSNAMIGFLGFIFIAGTILGVVIDGIHHRIIELWYFSYIDTAANYSKDMKHITMRELEEHLRKQMRCDDNCISSENCKFAKEGSYGLTKIYYAFNLENIDKCVALHDYLRRTVYHYYEFYANTFIAMIPFSIVTPIYMVKMFDIDYDYALGAGIFLAVLTIACLDFAWMAYDRWISDLYFAFCRCLKGRTLEWNKYRETFYDFLF
jgi:hypothetical protein